MIRSRSDDEDDPALQPLWGDYWVKVELSREIERLGAALVNREPDMVIDFFGQPMKKPPPAHSRNLVWLYSHPDMVTPENLRGYDRIFCASHDFIPRLSAMGYGRVEYMPACTAKRPVVVPVQHDVIFLGNARVSRSDGRAVVRAMGHPDHGFRVWGHRWDGVLPSRYYGGRYWEYDRLEELYASARITLNDHNHDMAREGFVSNKIFDILAGGGFALSDQNQGLDHLFEEAVPQFRDPAHLKELVARFLGDDEERARLRRLGQDIALRHTYRDRAVRFLSAGLATPPGP